MTVRIVKHAFEIIHLLTGEVGPRARRGEYPEAPDANSTPAIGMPGPSRDGEGRGLGVRLMHVPLRPPEPPAGPGERHHQQRPPGGLHPHWASWNSEAAGRGRVPTAPCESGGLGAFGHTWALRNGHQAGSECCLGQRLATGDVHLCLHVLPECHFLQEASQGSHPAECTRAPASSGHRVAEGPTVFGCLILCCFLVSWPAWEPTHCGCSDRFSVTTSAGVFSLSPPSPARNLTAICLRCITGPICGAVPSTPFVVVCFQSRLPGQEHTLLSPSQPV